MTAESTGAGARRRIWIAAASVGGVVVVGLVALGVVPLPGSGGPARPPCERLPTAGEVRDALAASTELVGRLETAGAEVTVATPCDDRDRALVQIAVSSGEERNGTPSTP